MDKLIAQFSVKKVAGIYTCSNLLDSIKLCIYMCSVARWLLFPYINTPIYTLITNNHIVLELDGDVRLSS